MNGNAKEKIQDIGVLFRFITPVLLAVVGFFTIDKLSAIDDVQNEIRNEVKEVQRSTIKIQTRLAEQTTAFEAIQRDVGRHEEDIKDHRNRIRGLEINNGRIKSISP